MPKIEFQDTFYNFSGQTYGQNGIIDLDELCNGLNVINIGTTVCRVNGIPLNPPAAGEVVGDSYAIGGNKGELLTGKVQLDFASGNGEVIVVQKYYVNF
jgi:hypothetical protein